MRMQMEAEHCRFRKEGLPQKAPFRSTNGSLPAQIGRRVLPRFRKRKENLAVLWIRIRRSSRSSGAKDSCHQNLDYTCCKSSFGLPGGTTYIQKQKVVTRRLHEIGRRNLPRGKSYLPFAAEAGPNPCSCAKLSSNLYSFRTA